MSRKKENVTKKGEFVQREKPSGLKHFIDMTGWKMADLEVIGYLGVHKSPKGGRNTLWEVKCCCGKVFSATASNLRKGNTKSCGCSRGKHKMTNTPEYIAWEAIIQRCDNPKNPGYKNYGGRGIKVCDRWRSFENFYADVGPRPKGFSLDRTNNEGDYSPENCRWVLNKLQHRNKRSNVFITIKGETRCITEWAEISGISLGCIRKRILNGWPAHLLLLPPDGTRKVKRTLTKIP